MKTRVFVAVVRLLQKSGVSGVYRLADFLGALMWRVLGSRRETTVTRIAQRLDLPAEQARRVARASFTHTARSFLDVLVARQFGTGQLPFHDPRYTEFLEYIAGLERPLVMITGHFGPWELAGAFASRVEGKRLFSVVRRHKDPAMAFLIRTLRLEYGLETVDHRDATGTVLNALRGNNIACFLVDHNTARKEAVFLPFLGQEAAVTMGPALLAVRAKALIQPIFARREPDGSVSLDYSDAPLDTQTLEGSVNERVRQAALWYTRAVERQVLACPEQWFWMHNRWKTQPK